MGPYRNRQSRAVVALILIGFTVTRSISAQERGPSERGPSERAPSEAQAIAAEAYVYGFPIVENYKTMVVQAIAKDGEEYKAPFNRLMNEADLFTPADTTVLTPNADTPYSFLWMDLRTEPLVLGMPDIEDNRYYSNQLIDLYTFNFGYIGSRATGNEAGHTLIAGPQWKGEKPEGVDQVIHCETEFALALYRTQLFGPDDLDQVKNIQSQYTVQTLSDFLGKPAPKAAPEIEFPPVDLESATDLAFFESLNFILQFCPTDPSETELMARFAKIGVGPSATFDASKLSPEIQTALKSGMADGQAAIAAILPKANSADQRGLEPSPDHHRPTEYLAVVPGVGGDSPERRSRLSAEDLGPFFPAPRPARISPRQADSHDSYRRRGPQGGSIRSSIPPC